MRQAQRLRTSHATANFKATFLALLLLGFRDSPRLPPSQALPDALLAVDALRIVPEAAAVAANPCHDVRRAISGS